MGNGSDAAYDPVATLYDRAFSDIRVRRAEWRWLSARLARLAPRPRVLEIGCGTGALLRALAPRVASGVGVDVAPAMLQRARARAAEIPVLRFELVSGSSLPFTPGSFDVAISFLSFRYLAWAAIWPEIRRVLRPAGSFLMVDLVSARAGLRDAPGLLRAGIRRALAPWIAPQLTRDLRALTTHPGWREMLGRHPIRPLEEYAGFFAEHVPGAAIEVLDVAPTRRVIALDSGPLAP